MLNVLGDLQKLRDKPSQAIPFGQEKVSREVFAERLAKMGAEERANLVETVGVDGLLEMLK